MDGEEDVIKDGDEDADITCYTPAKSMDLATVCQDFINWCENEKHVYDLIDRKDLLFLEGGNESLADARVHDLVEQMATYIFDSYYFRSLRSQKQIEEFFKKALKHVANAIFRWLEHIPAYWTYYNYIGSKESLEVYYNHAHDIFINQIKVADKMVNLNQAINRDINTILNVSCTSFSTYEGKVLTYAEIGTSPIPLTFHNKSLEPRERATPVKVAETVIQNYQALKFYFNGYHPKQSKLTANLYSQIKDDLENIYNEIQEPIDTVFSTRVSIGNLQEIERKRDVSLNIQKSINDALPEWKDDAYQRIMLTWNRYQ